MSQRNIYILSQQRTTLLVVVTLHQKSLPSGTSNQEMESHSDGEQVRENHSTATKMANTLTAAIGSTGNGESNCEFDMVDLC